MNRRALIIGLLYCIAAISFKLILLLGGYLISNFGFYYSHFISVLAIIPFLFVAVYLAREKDAGGSIGGRDAIRVGLTVVAVAVVLMSVYNYIEFKWKGGEMAHLYYNSQAYLEVLKKQALMYPDKVKADNFPAIIREQIDTQTGQTAFKAATAKLVPLVFLGLSGAFIAAVFMKRSARQGQ